MEQEKITKISVVTKPEESLYFALASEIKQDDPEFVNANFITSNAVYKICVTPDDENKRDTQQDSNI